MNETDANEELGPLLVAPPPYFELRRAIRLALGFPGERLPLLIGVDGEDGSGKSSLASWLSWQLEMPAIHLDMYIIRDSEPIAWRLDDLRRVVDARVVTVERPVIVEGVQLLRALGQIHCAPDFHVFVEKERHQSSMPEHIDSYLATYSPRKRADRILRWSSSEHDARVMRAHRRHGNL